MAHDDLLTAERMLSLPRPGSALPAPGGRRFLQSSSSYDFDKDRTSRSVFVGGLDGSSLKEVLVNLAFAGADWLDDSTLLYLRPPGAEADVADVKEGLSDKEAEKDAKGCEVWAKKLTGESYRITSLPVKVANFTVKGRKGQPLFVFSADVYPEEPRLDRVAPQEEEHEKAKHGASIRVYDTLMVRHWDEWTPQTVSHLFAIPLEFNGSQWRLKNGSEQPEILAPMADTMLQCPVAPFGGSEDYDVSSDGRYLIFTSKHPTLNPAWHTNQPIYLVPLRPRNADEQKPRAITSGSHGATSSPVFSTDGKRVAWLEMSMDGYEADRNKIVIYDLQDRRKISSDLADASWQLSPSRIQWAPDGSSIYITAEDRGHKKLFQLEVDAQKVPQQLTSEHTIADFAVVDKDTLLLTVNSFTHPNQVYTLSRGTLPKKIAAIAPAVQGDKGEEFWFYGARQDVHGFLIRPPNFDKSKKWPLVFWVHGGPQAAFLDTWSTRWNPNVWASQGYIVSLINPTGSTGYGQPFTDAIQNDWGGGPYKDLRAGLDFLLKAYPEIDPNRTVAAGASYGGYMMNWFQSQGAYNMHICASLLLTGRTGGLGFKALVNHDGIFDTVATYTATDELYFPEHDHSSSTQGGATLWEAPANYTKHNPRDHVANWSTPQLTIHGRRDYRLSEAESLSTFNCLQRKGIPSRLLIFEEASHWVLRPQDSRAWHFHIFEWYKEWVGSGQKGPGRGH